MSFRITRQLAGTLAPINELEAATELETEGGASTAQTDPLPKCPTRFGQKESEARSQEPEAIGSGLLDMDQSTIDNRQSTITKRV